MMNHTGHSILDRALGFLELKARPLEARRWDFIAGNIGSDVVLDELMAFAYPDGGFGRALESDMRADLPSVLGTVEALDIMAEVGLAPDHPVRLRALEWLCSSYGGYDDSLDLWPYLKACPTASVRAPWWDMDNLEETFGGYLVNPRGRVIAHLHLSGVAAPTSGRTVDEHREDILRIAEGMDEASPDTLRSLLKLSEALGDGDDAGSAYRKQLDDCIIRLIPRSVEKDPGKWGEYGLQPLEVAESPESPWFRHLEQEVAQHLDHLAATQLPEGSWAPFWTWGGRFPDAWKDAEREWKGVLTVRNLKRLKAFGRLD